MARYRRDDGMTLIEVVVASTLTLIVLIMGYQILSATTKTAAAVGNRAQNTSIGRLSLDSLENSLRYADAVWVCGPLSGTVCTTPVSSTTTTLYVQNASGSSITATTGCVMWNITSANTLTVTPVTTAPSTGTAQVVATGVTAVSGTYGFSMPLARLVQIDFQVNQETVNVQSGDAVTVHDLVAPDNLTTQQGTGAASTTPC